MTLGGHWRATLTYRGRSTHTIELFRLFRLPWTLMRRVRVMVIIHRVIRRFRPTAVQFFRLLLCCEAELEGGRGTFEFFRFFVHQPQSGGIFCHRTGLKKD